MQDLVGVDVADAGDDPCVHEKGLDRLVPVAGKLLQVAGVEPVAEGFHPETGGKLLLQPARLAGRPDNDTAEAAAVVEAQLATVIQPQAEMVVPGAGALPGKEPQAAGHAEMHHQYRSFPHPDKQVLGPPVDGRDGAALDPLPEQPARHGPAQPPVAPAYPGDPAAGQVRQQSLARYLHLGQLRHGPAP